MTTQVIVVGDIVTDVVAVLASPLAEDSDTPARITITGGGQAANTAAWLAWVAGQHDTGTRPAAEPHVTLVAAVGADAAGDARLAELRAAGVRCAVTRRPDAPTGTIMVLARGQRRTMVTERGANLTLSGGNVEAALDAVPPARHLHLSGYTLLDAGSREAGRRALAAARERGLTTSVDAASAAPLRQVGASAFAGWVRGVDLLLANGDEAAALSSDAGGGPPAACGNRPAGMVFGPVEGLVRVAVVVKRGPAGAVWIGADGSTVEVPAVPTEVIDPTGAGDAFAAGLLAAWLSGAAPAEALRAGARLGALAVRAVGARPPYAA